MPLWPEQTPLGAAAVGAYEAIHMQVALELEHTNIVLSELRDWKVDHTLSISHSARWLHVSQAFLFDHVDRGSSYLTAAIHVSTFFL